MEKVMYGVGCEDNYIPAPPEVCDNCGTGIKNKEFYETPCGNYYCKKCQSKCPNSTE